MGVAMPRRCVAGLLYPFPHTLSANQYLITPNIALRRKPVDLAEQLANKGLLLGPPQSPPLLPIERADFLLEVSYEGPVSDPCDSDSVERVLQVERAMRLVRPSPLHIPYVLYSVDGELRNIASSRSQRLSLSSEAAGSGTCALADADVEEVRATYEWISTLTKPAHPRLFYALYEYEIAHEMRYAELQVIMLVSGLESLFATDSQELTEKLALRTAWFLEEHTETRKETYRQVKRIYRFRSHYVHGGTEMREDMKRMREMVSLAEGLLRRCLQKIRRNRLEDRFCGRGVDQFLADLTLGVSGSSAPESGPTAGSPE